MKKSRNEKEPVRRQNRKRSSRNRDKILSLDTLSTIRILELMHESDVEAFDAVGGILKDIARVVKKVRSRLLSGGRLFYIGAGTSGRLGILDAVECPPTFGTSPEMVQGIIAGGNDAIFKAKEYSEDDPSAGEKDLKEKNVSDHDAVIGITASGTTPYVHGALQFAKNTGSYTALITCNNESSLINIVNDSIVIKVGPEILEGSTRLKAGTATKMVLNMISTAVMIGLGRVMGNRMISVHTGSSKLHKRAVGIIRDLCGISEYKAKELLEKAGGKTPVAVIMGKIGLGKIKAERILDENDGDIKKALKNHSGHYEQQ